jgi:hypothetical protein
LYYARISENLKLLSDLRAHIVIDGVKLGEGYLEKVGVA